MNERADEVKKKKEMEEKKKKRKKTCTNKTVGTALASYVRASRALMATVA